MASFRIFKDQENEIAGPRKLRNEKVIEPTANNVLQPLKRPVLGVVNENKLRVQQPRAAKQAQEKFSKNENPAPKPKENKQKPKPGFAIHEDQSSDETVTLRLEQKPSKSNTVAEVKPKVKVAEKQKPSTSRHTEKPQDEISSNIALLHIPDSEDSLFEIPFKTDLDMSIDSLGGSPMSVDKTLSVRAIEYQQVLEQFYNVEEYDEEIFKYMQEAERLHRPKPGYMRKQPDITYSMRSILVDWLVEVADEYNLQTETLYLAVSYIDRFLSFMSVVRGKLQLVGTSAMFIAAKFEEIYPPDVGEFVYITDDTYTKKQVLRMEHLILKVLAFDMSTPTALRFATKYSMITKCPNAAKHLTLYLCELSMLDAERFLQFIPSEIAGAATALARHTLGLDPWPVELQELTHTTLAQLTPCLKSLTEFFATAGAYPQQAVRDKYKSSKWSCVSLLSPLVPGLVECDPMPPTSTQDSSKLQGLDKCK